MVQRLKGKTSSKLLNEFSHLRKTYGGDTSGARLFLLCSGNVTDEIIKQYIESQDVSSDDNFKVEGDAEV